MTLSEHSQIRQALARAGEATCVGMGQAGDADLVSLLGADSCKLNFLDWRHFRSRFLADRRRLSRQFHGKPAVIHAGGPATMPLLPHFIVLVALLRPSCLWGVAPDGTCRRISWAGVAAALGSVVWASLRALLALGGFFLAARPGRRKASSREALPGLAGGDGSVLYLKTNFSFSETQAGGSLAHTAGVVNALADKGKPTFFITAEAAPELRPGVEIFHLPPPGTAPLPTAWYGLLLAKVMARQAKEFALSRGLKPGFVYQRLVPFNAAGMYVARALGIPWVLEYNGSEAWVAKHWGQGGAFLTLSAAFERAALLMADRVVVVSDLLRQELLEMGVGAERITMYPNCVDPTLYSPGRFSPEQTGGLRSSLGIDRQDMMCTFVGTFGKWHGAEILAQAVAQWHASDPGFLKEHRLRFVFVGDGLMMPEVRRTLGPLVDQGLAVLTGIVPQAQTPLYLAASDVLVSPHVANQDGSRFFGSPTKLFEYMAMAKPIVASDLEQIGDILRPGLAIWEQGAAPLAPHEDYRLAVLCRPGAVEDIQRAVKFLALNPACWPNLGEAARKRVMERYTWQRHVAEVLG